ncbi:MAG: small ribosomal subunit Rsm22 family protein [Halobacteriaceae archaeon]
MPSDRRQAVREGAQYLRAVRPIDPEEVATFVPGGAHPGVVRTDLRALAPELGLVERPDGTFVPVPSEPVDPDFEGVEALPTRVVDRVEAALVETFGPDWASGADRERLQATIDRLKAAYDAGEPIEYDRETVLAYACYHLPTHYAAACYVLDELGRDGLLEHELRILDVGAGIGGPAIAVDEYLPDDALVEYHAVEPSDAALELFETLTDGLGRNRHVRTHEQPAADATVEGSFDLVLFSSVLSELAAPADTAASYLEHVDQAGTLALISTGDRETSTTLRSVERTLVDDRDLAAVYAPTVRLWADARPTDRGWSWRRDPDLAVPAFQAALMDGDDTYRNTSVRYSYALLRPDGRERYDGTLDRALWGRMADAEDHVTNRVDLVGAKLSPDLGTGNPLFKVSDGSETVDHYAVLVHESELTQPLLRAPYGALLAFENVLVLWNDDEAGYNLVVDDEAIVEPFA